MQNKSQDLIKNIPIPTLNSSQYGKDVHDAFKIIDDNFKKISYNAFSQGEAGENMYACKLSIKKLHDNNTPGSTIITESGHTLTVGGLYDKLKSAIISQSTPTELGDVDGVSWDQNINEGGLQYESEIILFYNYNPAIYNSVIKTSIVSSTVFYFIDARFNKDLSKANGSDYIPLKDISCTLMIQNNPDPDWISSQLYPTLYYQEGVGFCWLINNIKTGLIAQGPQGTPGNSAQLYMVVGTHDDVSPSKINIFGVFDMSSISNSQWITWEKFISNNSDWENISKSPSIIFTGTISGNDIHIEGSDGYWISNILIEYTDPPKAYSICPPSSNVGVITTNKIVIDALNKISVTNTASDELRGLYIPFQKNRVGKSEECHLISAIPSSGSISGPNDMLTLLPVVDVLGTPIWTGDKRIPELQRKTYEILLKYGIVHIFDKLNVDGKAAIGPTTVNNNGEFACGKYNSSNNPLSKGHTVFSIGSGTSGQESNTVEVNDEDDFYIKNIGGFEGVSSTSIPNPITGAFTGPASIQDVINYPVYPLKSLYYYPAQEHSNMIGGVIAQVNMAAEERFRKNRMIIINTNNFSTATLSSVTLDFSHSGYNFKDGDTWMIRKYGPVAVQLKFDSIFIDTSGSQHTTGTVSITDDNIYYVNYVFSGSSAVDLFIVSK